MKEKRVSFYSDGLKLDGSFYLPDKFNKRDKKPILLICSGFTGLKKIHPERFSGAMTEFGYPCFGFDYRGFGDSEGAWHKILIEEQIRDIVNASVLISAYPEYSRHGLILMGWGMGGGCRFFVASLIVRSLSVTLSGNFHSRAAANHDIYSSINSRGIFSAHGHPIPSHTLHSAALTSAPYS